MENNLNKVSQSVILKGEKKGLLLYNFALQTIWKKKRKLLKLGPRDLV